MSQRPACVLFDLDGTLADTAPDLIGALNDLRAERGLAPVPEARLRPAINGGAAGIVGAGLDDDAEPTRQRFLELYEHRVCRDSRLFPGIGGLLNALDARNVPWGVVTNKQTALTLPILDTLGLGTRSRVVVCGDTLAERKPHPAPVRHALEGLGADPAESWYLGDAPRDIRAAHAAGTRAAVALWGYIEPDDDPRGWGADYCLEAPEDTLALLYPDPRETMTP